jgi:peptidoglycan/LPS O-acetylase OafA/YrhL
MSKGLSVLLDILRVAAALGVILEHAETLGFLHLGLPKSFGHRMVVIFFVLSGLVIYHTSSKKSLTLHEYSVARLSRLASVVVPALLLTLLVDLLLSVQNPDYFGRYARPHHWNRYSLAFTGLNEIWFLSAAPPANAPFWSIGYELWYYVLFAVVFFLRAPFMRWGAALLIALLIGPKILILLPIWLLGVITLRELRKRAPSRRYRRPFWASLIALCVFLAIPLPNPLAAIFREGYAPLFYSSSFISDYQLGIIVAAVIFTFALGFHDYEFSPNVERAVRFGAGLTFSSYLSHYPLLMLLRGISPALTPNSWLALLLVAVMLAVIVALSAITEKRRHLWKAGLERLLNPAKSVLGAIGVRP